MSEATTTKKKPIIDVFLGGAKRGFYIGVETVLPSMILGYVIMQFLTLTGLMDVLGYCAAPLLCACLSSRRSRGRSVLRVLL